LPINVFVEVFQCLHNTQHFLLSHTVVAPYPG
jgi:hypothetical protein